MLVSAPFDEREDVVEHAPPHKRAEVEVVVLDAKRNNGKMDESVKSDALDDFPPGGRKHANPVKATANSKAFKSHAPKAQTRAAAKSHPYLRRSETRRR